MSKEFVLPPKLEKGDKVAIIGVGTGPAHNEYPHVYNQGIDRLKNVFGLEPVNYPTAYMDMEGRRDNPEQRANELMQAFEDPEIKGVIAPIGGSGEQVRIIKHLDAERLKSNPTRFYGYSDNTSLNLYLWSLGIISFQGPMVMTELAMQGGMHNYTKKYCRKAFFSDELGYISCPDQFTDEDLEWEDSDNLDKKREMENHPGWDWHNTSGEKINGRTWGGCLEVIDINLKANTSLPKPEKVNGDVLMLETSEETPKPILIKDFIVGLGERGYLDEFSAVVVGLPKARSLFNKRNKQERIEYRKAHKRKIKEWIMRYNSDLPILFNFNIGHIDPMIPFPVGGKISIDTDEKTVNFY